MPDDLTPLQEPAFATALNDLDDLLTQSGKVFMIGAGCSICAGLPLTTELTAKTLASTRLDATTNTNLTVIVGLFVGAKAANIEDYLSELVDLVAIAERRGVRGATTNTASLNGVEYTAKQLKDAVDQIKQSIAEVIEVDVKMECHWKFIQAVHRPSRPGRSIATRPVDYLILNYDTLIESALARPRHADNRGQNSPAQRAADHRANCQPAAARHAR